MSRYFERARKIVNNEPVVDIEGKEVYWDIKEENFPEYSTAHAAGADFKAAEDVTIPSKLKTVIDLLLKDGILTANWFTSMIKNGGASDIKLTAEIREQNRKDMEPTIIHTGIKAYMQEDEVLLLFNRSSGPKKLGLILANSVGVIDADYYGNPSTDGEIMFAFYNILPFDIKINKGDKIGQGVFSKFLRADGAKVGGERLGGFGSTGK